MIFVGVRCPLDVIMQRRNAGQAGRKGMYARGTPDDPVPEPVRRWQREVHRHGMYDLEVDTSQLTPLECAEVIRAQLQSEPEPSAFARLASELDG